VVPIATVLLLLSVWSGGARAHTGDWIDSAYATAPPTIDGALSPGEWAAATTVDLMAIPGNGLPGFLLIENNATFLYVAYDAFGDETNNSQDVASVAFDTGHDTLATVGGEDEFEWGAGAPSGQAHLNYQGTGWTVQDSPFNPALPNHAGLAGAFGFGPSDLSIADHRVYELRIPLVLLGLSPGQVIGFLGGSESYPGVQDASTFAYSTWPDFLLGPPSLDGYGDLRLGHPAQPNDLDLNPPSQVGMAAPFKSIRYALTAVNRGASDDTFEITVTSAWGLALFDATGMNPLPDTDGDLVPDTGLVPSGGSAGFVVRIDVPPTSGCANAVITGTSANNAGVSDTALLHTCTPPAVLDPPHVDRGVDTDVPPNGRYDLLQIDVYIIVSVAGFYTVDVNLFDGTQTSFITFGSGSGFFPTGQNVLAVTLPAADIYRSAIDGPYAAELTLYDGLFNQLDNGTHVTAAYNATDFEPPAALFNPPHSDFGLDTDVPPDGTYDFLAIDTQVMVNKPGTFTVDAQLLDAAFNLVATTTGVATLSTGVYVIPLRFLGRDIENVAANGPYTAFLVLLDATGTLLDTNLYTTGPYNWFDFEAAPAFFSPPHSDQGVDLSVPPDGYFEFLEIGASLQVREAGRFSISVDLYDSTGTNFIGSAVASVNLGTGLQQVPVEISGADIASAAYDGPYQAILSLRDDLGTMDRNAYTTGFYTWTQFAPVGARLAPPYADRLVDADVPPDGLADWLAVDVGVYVAIPGPYDLGGVLLDPAGRIVGSANGCGALAAGLQTCTLMFDGHAIASSGSQGPFVADFRLFDRYGRFLGRDIHVTAPYANGEFEPRDTTAPTATAGSVPYWVNQAPLLVPFAASDPSPTDGLASVTLWYRHSADNATWGPWTPEVTVAVSGTTVSDAVPFLFASGVGYYEFEYTATDRAGNAEGQGPVEASVLYRPLASLAVVPGTLNVPAGQQRTLQIRVLGTDGQPATLASPLVVSLGSTSPTGEFRTVGTATRVPSITIPAGQSSGSVDFYDRTAGNWILVASSTPTADGYGQATVAAGPAATVTISPGTVSVPVGGTFTFAAQAFDQYGNALAASFTWNAEAQLGTIAAGLLTAATRVASGNVTVSVSGSPSANAVARVTLIPGPATVIVLAPGSVTLPVGGVQPFLAAARDTYGNAVTATFVWSADPAVGTISPGGVLIAATTVGAGLVTAALSGNPAVRGTATVTLAPGAPAQVVVSPPSMTLAVDGTAAFTAAVADRYGNAIASPPITWSATNGIGSLDSAGLFTAGHTAGLGVVIATAGSAQGSASVTVTPGPLARLAIDPPDATVTVGTTSSFTVQGYDQYGNAVGGLTVTWSTTGGIGAIDATGLLTAATNAASGHVVATSGAITATAAVTLEHGAANQIQLNPNDGTIGYGTEIPIRAIVVDQYGNPLPGAMIAWTVTGPGTLSTASGQSNVLTATQAGQVTVTATSGTVSASARFTVLGPPPAPEPSNAPLVGAGALIAGLAVGLGIGWVIRGRRGAAKKERREAEDATP